MLPCLDINANANVGSGLIGVNANANAIGQTETFTFLTKLEQERHDACCVHIRIRGGLNLTIQAVQSVPRPDTVGCRWHQVASTVTRVADVL